MCTYVDTRAKVLMSREELAQGTRASNSRKGPRKKLAQANSRKLGSVDLFITYSIYIYVYPKKCLHLRVLSCVVRVGRFWGLVAAPGPIDFYSMKKRHKTNGFSLFFALYACGPAVAQWPGNAFYYKTTCFSLLFGLDDPSPKHISAQSWDLHSPVFV